MRRLKEILLNLNISKKLMGGYLIATALPLILVGLYLNISVRNVVENNAIFEAEANLEKVEIQLENAINRVTQASDLVYLDKDIESLLTDTYDSTFEIYKAYANYPVFDDFLEFYEEIENIQFFMERSMISNSYFISVDDAIEQTEWYQEAKNKQGRISWLIKEEHWTKERYLTLTRAVYGTENQYLGVVTIYVSMDKLRRMISSEIHDTYIILDNDTIVYATDATKQFMKPTFLSGFTDEELNQTLLFDDTYEGEDVKINVRRLKPEKSLQNDLQVASIIPLEMLMAQPNKIFFQGYLIIIGVLVISMIGFRVFIRTFKTRINTLKSAMGRVARGQFNIEAKMVGTDEIGEAYDELYETSQSLQKLIDEVYVHKIKEERWYRQQKESEFKMLSSQINPHFLYNTLEMIRMKALVNKDPDVATLIKKLSKMMRQALERTDRPVTLKDELSLIENYLEIQAMRFGEHFSYTIEVQPGLDDYKVFPLLIQPIVENAIVHGLEPKEERGHLTLTVIDDGKDITIAVHDNGVGMTPKRLTEVRQGLSVTEHLNGRRIGIRNVHQRMMLYYGQEYGLTIKSTINVGTTMTLRLPKRN